VRRREEQLKKELESIDLECVWHSKQQYDISKVSKMRNESCNDVEGQNTIENNSKTGFNCTGIRTVDEIVWRITITLLERKEKRYTCIN
jgi:hypothetical protein